MPTLQTLTCSRFSDILHVPIFFAPFRSRKHSRAKLLAQYGLAPDADVWAVTCFEVAPSHRGRGAAARLLAGILDDLRSRGVARVQGFPRPGERLEPGAAWTGPEGLFRSAGFREVGRAERGPVLELALRSPPPPAAHA